MIAPEQPGLLSRMSGVLALRGLRLLSASVQTHAGSAVNTFLVSPLFGEPPEVGRLRQQLIQAVDGGIDVIARLDVRERETPVPTQQVGGPEDASVPAVPALFAQAPPKVLWFDGYDDNSVILELRASDRLGLLARVSAVLEHYGANITLAKVATLGGSVVDSFCIHLPGDGPSTRDRIEESILAVVPPPAPPREPEEDSGKSGVPIG
jgi:[protein-PII] uridylyltransferase